MCSLVTGTQGIGCSVSCTGPFTRTATALAVALFLIPAGSYAQINVVTVDCT